MRLLRLIEQKRPGRPVEIPEPEPEPAPQAVPADLLRALQESLEQARGSTGSGHRRARPAARR